MLFFLLGFTIPFVLQALFEDMMNGGDDHE